MMRYLPTATLVLAVLHAASIPLAGQTVPSQAAAEQAKANWTPEIRAALGFESADSWGGGTLVEEPVREGARALRWDRHTTNHTLECLHFPRDLSAFNVMTFWLHSSHENRGTFRIILESGHDPDLFSYYSAGVTVDWTGWKQVSLPFNRFGRSREPAGWDQIDRITFRASGWNQEPTDESVWVIDAMDFVYSDAPQRPGPQFKLYVEPPPREAFAANLRPGHPRLIMLDEDLARIRTFVAEDPQGQVWYERARAKAEELFDRPVETHRLPDGRRLLSVSRSVLDRMFHWGFMHRMDGDPKWLDRAWREMEAVVNFPDWNPSHYLDTAEMMHAIALGYDWFHNELSEERRAIIREGLWQHGLRLSYATYRGITAEGQQHWYRASNNWNFVCNGGTALAAMVMIDHMPEECSYLLHYTYEFMQQNLRLFEPDGAWWEGVGYWAYSMRYLIAYLRGLETAFGTDFGFVEALQNTGLAVAGDFPIYLSSPFGGTYNFANSGTGTRPYQHWALHYLANRFRNPLYDYVQRRNSPGGVYDLIYHQPFVADLAPEQVALDKHFRETEVATMRGSWTDPHTLFAGLKSGTTGDFHSHQDLGSFILYALGERWAIDMGTEGQVYRMHQNRLPKTAFYRIREEGHNTLVLNPGPGFSQAGRARARIERFDTSPKEAVAFTDLTHAYSGHGVASVRRGFRLLDHRRALLVQDEIRSEEPNEIYWFSHADRGIEFEVADSGRHAMLRSNGKTCHVHLLSPPGAVFTVMDASPLPTSPAPDIQNQNRGYQKLAIHLPAVQNTTIAVVFAPVFDFEPVLAALPAVAPIDTWEIAEDTAPRLAALLVGGEPLPGFTPDVFTYSLSFTEIPDALPVLTARSAAPGATVQTDMPTEFPGTARITVRDGNAATTYLLRFVPAQASPLAEQMGQRVPEPETVDGVTVAASLHDGNRPANVLDGNLETRWSANGQGEWIAFDFGQPRQLAGIGIAWFSGDQRQSRFRIEVSNDGEQWREIATRQSSGTSLDIEGHPFPEPATARHLRLVCFGNTQNLWNSITAVQF